MIEKTKKKFKNRREAAELLALELHKFAAANPLIVGIPRGGVPMARIIADALKTDMDVILVHKLRSHLNPEYAIGAIDEQGNVMLSESASQEQAKYIRAEVELEKKMLSERRQLYTPVREPVNPRGRVVIIVDDGIATGWTIKAAIRSLQKQQAREIIVAAPVGAPETLREIQKMADQLVILSAPVYFSAVGEFFEEFNQVDDDEVIRCLREQDTLPELH